MHHFEAGGAAARTAAWKTLMILLIPVASVLLFVPTCFGTGLAMFAILSGGGNYGSGAGAALVLIPFFAGYLATFSVVALRLRYHMPKPMVEKPGPGTRSTRSAMTSPEADRPTASANYDELLPYAPPIGAQSNAELDEQPNRYVESLPLKEILIYSWAAVAASVGLAFVPDRNGAGTVFSYAFPEFATSIFALFCMWHYEQRGARKRSIGWKTVRIAVVALSTIFMFFPLWAVLMYVLTEMFTPLHRWIPIQLVTFIISLGIAYPVTFVFMASDLRTRMPL